ncbi:MAG: AMP-binding protein [bacterium]
MRVNIGDFLARRAMLSPRREGLICEGRRWTFGELNRRANRAAHAMQRIGVRPGDRVGILSLNSICHFDLFFGLAKIGSIMVPINYRLAPPELKSIFNDSGIDVLVYSPEFLEVVEEAGPADVKMVYTGDSPARGQSYNELLQGSDETEPARQAGDDDELVILYTIWSTTGPRGVVLSHKNFFFAAVSAIATLHQMGDTFLLTLPLFHIGALGWLPFFMHRGTRCVLMPRFEPDLLLEHIETEGVTSFGAVPTMLYLIKESSKFASCDFSGVRSILAYGSAVPPELIREYADSDIRVRQLYGLTESAGPALVIDFEHALEKAGSCGLPFFHTRINLVDHAGEEVPQGEVGEVVIQANHVMKYYWNNAEASSDVLQGDRLYTGDLARQDQDGYFYIVDRKKELIISGGENIFPAEVERVLSDHPDIRDVAVIGEPDPLWGESVKAVAVLRPGTSLTEKELIEWCQGRIASYKAPRRVEFVDELPRSRLGKMDKTRLRQGRED